MLKEVGTQNSNNKSKFPDYTGIWTNLKRLYTIISWQIYSVKLYLYHFLDSTRFYRIGQSKSGEINNFSDYYEQTDGAADADLLKLAKSMGISATDFSSIMLEWESKFLPRTTEEGIKSFIKLFLQYNLVGKGMNEKDAATAVENVEVVTKNWYNSTITDGNNVYFYNDSNLLQIYIEIIIPKDQKKNFFNMRTKIYDLIKLVYQVIVPTVKISYVEVIWR